MNACFYTGRHYSVVGIDGKVYTKIKHPDADVNYSVHCKNGTMRRLHTPAILARIDAAIVELAHAEALVEWEEYDLAAAQIRIDALVKNGDELRASRQLRKEQEEVAATEQWDDWANSHDSRKTEVQMIESDHEEALEMNRRCSELYYRYWRWWNVMDEYCRADDFACAHKTALKMNSTLNMGVA